MCSDSFVPLHASGDDTFRGAIKHVDIAGIGVSQVRSTRSVVYRHESLIAAEPRDDVLLSIHLTGAGSVEQAGRLASLVPGSASMYEADRPYDLRFESAMSELVLQVPRRRVRLRDSAIRDSTARLVARDAEGLVVLRHFLQGILEGGCPDRLADQVAETAIDLLVATLQPYTHQHHRTAAMSAEALRHAAHAFIQRNLHDPDLDVDTVARRHATSRRTLEAAFAAAGESPAGYLRAQRLERACHLLAETTMTIADVAAEVGFADVNTFTRSFKRAHGQVPREWRKEVSR